MEPELAALAKWHGRREPWLTAVSSPESVEACGNKLVANAKVRAAGVPVPDWSTTPTAVDGPLIIKPQRGTGSRGMTTWGSAQDVIGFTPETHFAQRLIRGVEYSVDAYRCFWSDATQVLARQRLATKGGLATHTLTVSHPKLEELTRRVLTALNVRGAANVQFLVDEKHQPHFIECNPRFGGATVASIHAGLSSPRYLLDECAGRPPAFDTLHYGERMFRYWEEVYLTTDAAAGPE